MVENDGRSSFILCVKIIYKIVCVNIPLYRVTFNIIPSDSSEYV